MVTEAASRVPVAVGRTRDIERHVLRLEDQLTQLRAQVRQAQQLAGLGTAAVTLAHEFSNLLTPIIAYAQSALATDDPALMRKALSVTATNTRMVSTMAERVLALGAANAPAREEVGVRQAVEDAAASLCRDVAKDGIRLVNEVDAALTVWFDPLQLTQVFFNLFLNARDAMGRTHNGRLTIRASTSREYATITVSDTGEGIPADLLPFVFDPLRSSKPAERAGKPRCGGLGLSLCRDLVTEGGGSIEVDSKPNSGTTFTILLPTAHDTR